MHEPGDSEQLWLTRRDGVVRGPFPAAWVRRYILLGRIRMTDELRLGAGEWRPAFRCDALIPEVLRQPLTEDNLVRLKQARWEADERGHGDRRADRTTGADRVGRRANERRQTESPDTLAFRARRARELCQADTPSVGVCGVGRARLVLGLLLGAILLAVLYPWLM